MAFMLSLWNEGFVVVSGCLRRVEQSQNCSFLGKKCQVLQCQGYQVTHGGMEGMVGGTMKRTLMCSYCMSGLGSALTLIYSNPLRQV